MKLYRISLLITALIIPSIVTVVDRSAAQVATPAIHTGSIASGQFAAFDLLDRGIPSRREGAGTR